MQGTIVHLNTQKFFEFIQTISAFFRIAFDFYCDYRLVLAEDEIHFVIAFSPVEYAFLTVTFL